jgi:hypothetical protein
MGLGRYSIAMASGAIAATGAADALIFACRWTDADKKALIEKISVNAVVTGTITTAVPYDLAAYFASAFTVAPTTSIAAATLSGRNNSRKTPGVDATLMNGIWILTTVAAGITGHTFTLDSQPLARISGASGTAIGTQFFGTMAKLLDYRNDEEIVLTENEGIAIRAPLAGPASGTFRVCVNMDWREIT